MLDVNSILLEIKTVIESIDTTIQVYVDDVPMIDDISYPYISILTINNSPVHFFGGDVLQEMSVLVKLVYQDTTPSSDVQDMGDLVVLALNNYDDGSTGVSNLNVQVDDLGMPRLNDKTWEMNILFSVDTGE
jgi:hypothetical protein